MTTIIWLCYWLVAAVSIPLLASMVHPYARHLYASGNVPWYMENEDYRANPISSVLISCGLALVWPLGYIAVGTLYLVSKEERAESERKAREKSIEEARAFLRKQELEAKADFDRMLGPAKPARGVSFPPLWRRP